jgi:hypothetical protein
MKDMRELRLLAFIWFLFDTVRPTSPPHHGRKEKSKLRIQGDQKGDKQNGDQEG